MAYSWALLSARWVKSVKSVKSVRGCCLSGLCHWSQDPIFGSIFHLGVRADTSHMTVSTPTGRLYGFVYLFIYFSL